MGNIYQLSLDEKFAAIVSTIARGAADDDPMVGLIVLPGQDSESLAEQAIFAWATERQRRVNGLKPITNLQHLLSEYCALADHL